MKTPRLTAALASGVLVAGIATAVTAGTATAAYERVDTCNGLPATIVGTPGVYVYGTAGPDVVVSNGATGVLTYGGDDFVCVTNTDPGYDDYVYVSVADGDDRVDTTGDVHWTRSELGPGEDVFTGGPGGDWVMAGDDGNAVMEGTEGRDVIRTGGGEDDVTAFSYEFSDHDDVDLGEGDDSVWISPTVAPDTRISGGDGVDWFRIQGLDERPWLFDNHSGGGWRSGLPWVHWSSLESFRLEGIGSNAAPGFIGGPADEHVEMVTDLTGDVAMGGGDDSAMIVSQRLAPGVVLAGGPGRDLLDANPFQTHGSVQAIEADLRGGRLRYLYSEAKSLTAPLRGFEDLRADALKVRVWGDQRPNALTVSGCNVEVAGASGADVIRWSRDYRNCTAARKPRPRIVLQGNGGNDVLTGGLLNDVLVGGPGMDKALGKSGVDRCYAERTVDCEVTGRTIMRLRG